jgi:hypothetical protein
LERQFNSCFQVLPAAEETLSFFCYSEQQAEQLQFSTWKVGDLYTVLPLRLCGVSQSQLVSQRDLR